MFKVLRHSALAGLLCLILLGSATTSFASNASISRYLAVAVKPQNEQQDLLQQQIQIKFPQNVLTIKQAIQFILQFSGYRLADNQAMDKPALEMLSQPLPEVDRTFGPMTLIQGLTTLSGKTFYLLVDPVHRLMAFKVRTNYHELYVQPTTLKNNRGAKQ